MQIKESTLIQRVDDYTGHHKPETGYTLKAMKEVLKAKLPDNTFIPTQLLLQFDGKETPQDAVATFKERRLPYHDDDTLDGTGDCSSVPGTLYEMLMNIDIGSYTEEIYQRYKNKSVAWKDRRPGDVVLYKFSNRNPHATHAATILGGGNIIHTTSPSNPLRVEKDTYGSKDRVLVARILSDEQYNALLSQNIVRDVNTGVAPPPPPAPKATHKYNGASYVYLRDIPGGTRHPPLAIINRGETVIDLEDARMKIGKTEWWRIKHLKSGKTGWCAYPNLFIKI